MIDIVYYSASGNTRRFVERLGLPAHSVDEIMQAEQDLLKGKPFLLITPTYSGQVPAPVKRLLGDKRYQDSLAGVVTSGNMNFGAEFGAAGKIISDTYGVQHLHAFELSGLSRDTDIVKEQAQKLWMNH